MVVPGIMVAASVVALGKVLDPTTITSVMTAGGIVVGWTVLAGMVTVYVTSAPRLLAGIALPTPALVYGVGRVKVEVLGLSAALEYTLPVFPLARV